MSSGLYSTEKRDFDTTLDLTKLRPYGDTMNDGKVQMSFTFKSNVVSNSLFSVEYNPELIIYPLLTLKE